MRNALFTSAGLHFAAILMVVVGMPALFDPEPLAETPISVEVVNASEMKRKEKPPTPPKPAQPPKRAVAKPPPPPAAPPQARPPPEPAPKPEAVPVKKAEPKPEPPKPKPAPSQKTADRPPPPKSRPTPTKPDDFQALLKNLADQARQRHEDEPEPPKKVAAVEPPPPRQEVSEIDRRRQKATLAHKVKQQVTPCWNIPAGAKDAHRMRIGVRVFLNPDGSLRGSPRLEDPDRMRRDPFYRALAESAIRALYNPRCSPLRLPPDQYELWQEISFNFDPREALE